MVIVEDPPEDVTVTGTAAVIPTPPLAAAVIVAAPDTAPAVTVMDVPVVALRFTTPAGNTDQLTVLSVALDGSTVALRVDVPLGLSVRDVGLRVIDDTGTGLTVTGIVTILSTPPVAAAVMVAVPAATPVTVIDEPVSALRFTIPAGDTDQLTPVSVAFGGERVVFMVKVPPG
jgi:hypothetical protein